MEKISKQEKEQLLQKRIEHINNSRKYATELFALYYKNPPAENWRSWQKLTEEKKKELVKSMIAKEDKAMIAQGIKLHRFNLKAATRVAHDFKVKQLIEYGIRKKDGTGTDIQKE